MFITIINRNVPAIIININHLTILRKRNIEIRENFEVPYNGAPKDLFLEKIKRIPPVKRADVYCHFVTALEHNTVDETMDVVYSRVIQLHRSTMISNELNCSDCKTTLTFWSQPQSFEKYCANKMCLSSASLIFL